MSGWRCWPPPRTSAGSKACRSRRERTLRGQWAAGDRPRYERDRGDPPAVAGGSSRRLAHFAHGGASRSRPSPSPNYSRACGGSLMAGARIHRRDGFGSALGAVARYCPSTTWPLTIVLTCSWPVSQQGRRSAPISTADAQITVICLVHGAACATRNVKDFAHTGVELVDPWCASG